MKPKHYTACYTDDNIKEKFLLHPKRKGDKIRLVFAITDVDYYAVISLVSDFCLKNNLIFFGFKVPYKIELTSGEITDNRRGIFGEFLFKKPFKTINMKAK